MFGGGVSEEQLEWLRAELAAAEQGRETVVVLGHLPLHPGSAPAGAGPRRPARPPPPQRPVKLPCIAQTAPAQRCLLTPNPCPARASLLAAAVCLLWNYDEVLEILEARAPGRSHARSLLSYAVCSSGGSVLTSWACP